MIMPSTHRLPAATATTTWLAAIALLALISTASLVTALAALAALIATTLATLVTAVTSSAVALATSVATTAATAVSATATAATAEATAAAGATLARFVDTDGAAIELKVVHGVDGSIGIGLLGVTDETETTATASITVLDDDSFLNGSELLKLLAERVLISVPCEASDE